MEKPALHYTIGTRVTPRVAKTLDAEGIKEITVHADPPPFVPHVSRILDIPGEDPDWRVRLSGFNLKRTFVDAASHGSFSPNDSTSYIPSLINPALLGKKGDI
jgi:hypothetical protein